MGTHPFNRILCSGPGEVIVGVDSQSRGCEFES